MEEKSSTFTTLAPRGILNGSPSEGQASGYQGKAERRRETRYPVHEPAEVRVLAGDAGLLPATVLDISRSGLRLEVTVQLPKGVAIEIVLPKEMIVFGKVRYCRRAGEAFHAGIFVDDVFYAGHAEGDNLHDDELSLYLARKGWTGGGVLGVRDHLKRCELCAARYHDGLRLNERLTSQAAER
jgi:hypothetical protein